MIVLSNMKLVLHSLKIYNFNLLHLNLYLVTIFMVGDRTIKFTLCVILVLIYI